MLLVLAAKALLLLKDAVPGAAQLAELLGVNPCDADPPELACQRNRIWVDAATFNSSVFLGALFMGMAAILMVEIPS